MQDIWPEILKKDVSQFRESEYYQNLSRDQKYLARLNWENRQRNKQLAQMQKEKKMLSPIKNGQRDVINMAYRKQRDMLQLMQSNTKSFLRREKEKFQFFTKNQKILLKILKKAKKVNNKNKLHIEHVKVFLKKIKNSQKKDLMIFRQEKRKMKMPNMNSNLSLKNIKKSQKTLLNYWMENTKSQSYKNEGISTHELIYLQNPENEKKKRFLKKIANHEIKLMSMMLENKIMAENFMYENTIKIHKNGIRSPKTFALQYLIQNADMIRTTRITPNKKLYQKNYFKNRKENDIVFKMRTYMSSSFRTYLEKNYLKKNGNLTIPSLGYSAKQLVRRLESTFEKDMNWKNFGKKWHIDHIIPCNFFKIDKPDHFFVKICWGLNNLQALERAENISKNDKMPDGSRVRDIKTPEQYQNMLKIVKNFLGFELTREQHLKAEMDFFGILQAKQGYKIKSATRPLTKTEHLKASIL